MLCTAPIISMSSKYIEVHIGEVENVIHAAVASILCLQRGLGLTYVLPGVEAAPQVRLHLCHGGFGLHNTTMAEEYAALLSGAAMAHSNLAEGPAACQLFGGLMQTSLMETWHPVFEIVGGECGWGPPLRDLLANLFKTLPEL